MKPFSSTAPESSSAIMSDFHSVRAASGAETTEKASLIKILHGRSRGEKTPSGKSY